MIETGAEEREHLRQLLSRVGDRVGDRDQAALTALYDHTSPILYGLLMRMLRRPDWAEEALQDCYLRVWQHAERYDPDKGEPIAWLIGIARYRALDRLQTARDRTQRLHDNEAELRDQIEEAPGPEQLAVEREGLERLQRCLRGLQEEQRRSVLMAYYEGYSHSELAQVMDAPLGTVKAWVRRGLARLRACLEQP